LEAEMPQREVLERWARRPTSSQALAFCCRVVLAAAEGRSSTEIAAELGCNGSTVGRWRGRFALRGLDGLHNEPRPGKPGSISDEDVERVHVVLDNSSTHKTPSIQRWLVRHPRFTLHFTPTYSSWLNLVERWFAELTTKWIKRGADRSVRDLVASIRTWITNWNDDPKPYVWHKTADEILDSLAAYCQRINDSGH
jgi:transposase